jgi:hypothetical protein
MGFEHVETDPPADCSCRWRNSADNAGWDRISTSDGCIRHNPSAAYPTQRCKGCPAQIVWALDRTGRRVPLDAEPLVGGNLYVTGHASDGTPNIRKLLPHQTFGRRLYQSHFATCPAAGAFRYRHETRAERRH